MYFVVLVEFPANKGTVDMSLIRSHCSRRRNNDSACRSTQIAIVIAEIPHNIRTALVEGSAVYVAEVEVIPVKSGGVNIDNNAYAVILSEHLFELILVILLVCNIVGVGGDDQCFAGLYGAVGNILVCTLERSTEAGRALDSANVLNKLGAGINKLIQRSFNIELGFSRLRGADSHIGRLYIQQFVVNAVGVEADSVSVVGILSLKAKVQDHLNFSVSRNARHIQPLGTGRSSAEIHDVLSCAYRVVSYYIGILKIELVDTLNSRITFKVVSGCGNRKQTEIIHLIQQ